MTRPSPILFIGRLAPVKNVTSLILACSRLKVPLHIYGDGPLKDDLEKLVRTCGAAVVFKGVVPNSALARVHHDHTIYVLCSTREGMPKSMIEAMASGLICVSTPTDGARELIEDGRTGYLTDGFDADAIERKLREVLDAIDPEVGRRASAVIRESNSLERAVEMEGAILDGIARDHRAPATAQTG
jgi:glycosyltransferase involved in cell wall biosynthesis